jgi:UDP-N-acetylglucosamine 2-epimerase
MKVISVVGARPQFIKCAPVSRELRKAAVEILVHTGQHYDDNMSDRFFHELDIPKPDYNLRVGPGSHGAQTGEMLKRIEEVLIKEQTDYVLVYGDTTSTLAGALAAVKLHIPVVHVEAGLRSFNRRMPEEINRVLTDHISMLLFCPTRTAVTNLSNEGITKGVHLVGDVMYDACLFYQTRAPSGAAAAIHPSLKVGCYALCTIHRAENTDVPERLSAILRGLRALTARGLPVLLPLHPRTRKVLAERGLRAEADGLYLTEPVSYLTMVSLEREARVILTDSGGVQKEAYFFGVPCITLRDETEWVETVESGWNTLVGASVPRLEAACDAAMTPAPRGDMTLYGDGAAASKIVQILLQEAHCGTPTLQ